MPIKKSLQSLVNNDSRTRAVAKEREGTPVRVAIGNFTNGGQETPDLNIDAIVNQVVAKVKQQLGQGSGEQKHIESGYATLESLEKEGSGNASAGFFVRFKKPFAKKPAISATLENTEVNETGGLRGVRLLNIYTKPENELQGFYATTNYTNLQYILHWIAIESE